MHVTHAQGRCMQVHTPHKTTTAGQHLTRLSCLHMHATNCVQQRCHVPPPSQALLSRSTLSKICAPWRPSCTTHPLHAAQPQRLSYPQLHTVLLLCMHTTTNIQQYTQNAQYQQCFRTTLPPGCNRPSLVGISHRQDWDD
jgi:hypothetical protein